MTFQEINTEILMLANEHWAYVITACGSLEYEIEQALEMNEISNSEAKYLFRKNNVVLEQYGYIN